MSPYPDQTLLSRIGPKPEGVIAEGAVGREGVGVTVTRLRDGLDVHGVDTVDGKSRAETVTHGVELPERGE